MADVINRLDFTVIVLNSEETDELSNLVHNHVDHYEGDTILFDLASALAGGFMPPVKGPDWEGLAELERTDIRESDEDKWRG